MREVAVLKTRALLWACLSLSYPPLPFLLLLMSVWEFYLRHNHAKNEEAKRADASHFRYSFTRNEKGKKNGILLLVTDLRLLDSNQTKKSRFTPPKKLNFKNNETVAVIISSFFFFFLSPHILLMYFFFWLLLLL